jgi:hypothetical protein
VLIFRSTSNSGYPPSQDETCLRSLLSNDLLEQKITPQVPLFLNRLEI